MGYIVSKPIEVEVRVGRTYNTGNYESLRLDLSERRQVEVVVDQTLEEQMRNGESMEVQVLLEQLRSDMRENLEAGLDKLVKQDLEIRK